MRGEHVAPVLGAVVEEQGHADVGRDRVQLREHERQDLGVGLAAEHAAHEAVADLDPAGSVQAFAQGDQGGHVEDRAALRLLLCGHPRHRGDRRRLVDGDEPADPVGAVLVDEAPPDRDAHRPAQGVEALEAEVVEQLVDVAREAGDPVAEMGLRRSGRDRAGRAVTTRRSGARSASWWRNIAWVWPQPCNMTSGKPSPPRSSYANSTPSCVTNVAIGACSSLAIR